MEIDSRCLSKEDLKKITALKVVLKNDYGPPRSYKIYKLSSDGIYSVPLLWGLKELSYTPPVSFKSYKTDIRDSVVKPRDSQTKCISACEAEMKKEFGGGIINLTTGSGKTMISIYLLAKYKYKTLIIVNTVELMDQWKKALIDNIPGVKIGIIRGDTFECEGYHVVIGMIQTISMRKEYTLDKFKFGMVFIDECHHLSSEVFSEAMFKTRCRYVFGLSATVKRQDGLEYVFKWHIGDVLHSNISSDKKQQTIFKKIDYLGKSSKEILMYNSKPNISAMVTAIAEDNIRTKLICDTLKELDEKRNVLVLSDRVFLLECIHKILGNENSGLFIGSVSAENRLASKQKRILLATYQIASEGFNHPKLNTLLFATPRSSVSQSIGRIYRINHTDISPMIIDIVDSFSVFIGQYKKRKKIYAKEISSKAVSQEECLFD